MVLTEFNACRFEGYVMKHWILTESMMQTMITNLDLNRMKLNVAKAYYQGYGVEIKGGTKAEFIKNLVRAVKD